jgi:hypothetical protein
MVKVSLSIQDQKTLTAAQGYNELGMPREALGELRENSGIDEVREGFAGVGSAIGDVLGKVAMIGAAVGAAVAGMLALVGEFDELGDKAEAIGVSVDFLAQMRYAAQRSGAEVGDLDSGLQALSKSLGQARANCAEATIGRPMLRADSVAATSSNWRWGLVLKL